MISSFVIRAPSSADERFVLIGPPIPVKLPGLADFPDHVEVQIGREYFILIARGLRDNLPARIAEVTGPVKLPDIPGRLDAHAVNGAAVVPVGDGVRRLLQL